MICIRYIWHDCFLVSLPSATLLFDYWRENGEENSARDRNPAFLDLIDPERPLYLFVSHGHKDHYNPVIFDWSERFREVRYVVSADVWKRMRHMVSPTSVYRGVRPDADRVTMLRPGDEFSDGTLRVRAFPSTDIGNSYVVECEGVRFFHAGDLNAWVWLDSSTDQEIRKAMGDYRACLRDLRQWLDAQPAASLGGDIDYCFFPVDSRLGRGYETGASLFVREFDVARFFPMHFALGDEEERRQRRADALRFELYANPERGEYIPLAGKGLLYCASNERVAGSMKNN